MHVDLAHDRQPTNISIRSIHLRKKYLLEEKESLQSICRTLGSLFTYWEAMAAKENDKVGTAGVSAIDDLRLLRDEFGIQASSRDSLVDRLSNVEALVCCKLSRRALCSSTYTRDSISTWQLPRLRKKLKRIATR